MSKYSMIAATVFAMAVVVSGALSTTANAATPNRIAFGLNNMTPGTCPAKVRLIVNVFAKSQGWVQVRFQIQGSPPGAPNWVWVATKPSGLHRGKYEKFFFPITAAKVKARAIVTGDGVTKNSNWDTLKVNC